MATKDTRGWQWTPEELGTVNAWKRSLQTAERRVRDQVARFHAMLPDLADQAALAAQPFLELSDPLLGLAARAGKRMYQPMSPEEATEKYRQAERHLAEWQSLLQRPDVVTAIRASNRRERAAGRAAKAERQRWERNALKIISEPDLLHGYALEVDTLIKTCAAMAVPTSGSARGTFGDHAGRLVLERYTHCLFIKMLVVERTEERAALRAFVNNSPAPSLDAVLEYMLWLFLRNEIKHAPGLGVVPSAVIAQIGADTTRLVMQAVDGWVTQGIGPAAIPQESFLIFGVDYSSDAEDVSSRVSPEEA